jgi:hypothetical protein
MRSWVRGWSHLAQAVAFGGIVTIIAIGLYWLYLVLPLPLSPNGIADGLPPSERLSLQLALGQVFLSFVTLFLAAALGYFAWSEFKERQERPVLHCGFHIDDEQTPEDIDHIRLEPDPQTGMVYIKIAIYNTGQVVSIWYIVRFEAPFLAELPDTQWFLKTETRRGSRRVVATPVEFVVGSLGANWNPAREADGTPHFTFRSEGQGAVYPHSPLVLIQLTLPPRTYVTWTTPLTFTYTIHAERIDPVKRSMSISVATDSTSLP